MFTLKRAIAAASLFAFTFAGRADDVATSVDSDVNVTLAMEVCDQPDRVQDEPKWGHQHRCVAHERGNLAGSIDQEVNYHLRSTETPIHQR